MFTTLATIVIIVSIISGEGGITVAATQNSQPEQPLYGLKVLSEDVRFNLSTDPQLEYKLALEFSNQRAEEIQTMLQAGSIPPEAVQVRYQNQVEQSIQYAMSLPDDQAVQALEQIRTQLRLQQQAFLQVHIKGSPQVEAILLQTRQMLQERLQWVENGLTDPIQLRDQLQTRDQQRKQDRQSSATPGSQATQASPGAGSGNPWATGTPTPGSGYGPGKGTGDCENCTPTNTGQGGNPWAMGTPTPGSGYGPGKGDGSCENCTPTISGQGGNPQATGTPTPGSGYGPGPGPDPTQACTPGSGNGYGPRPTQPQGNQPTQAGPQPTQGLQPTSTGSGSQSTTTPNGPGGKP